MNSEPSFPALRGPESFERVVSGMRRIFPQTLRGFFLRLGEQVHKVHHVE
jgi:hypothetical protein